MRHALSVVVLSLLLSGCFSSSGSGPVSSSCASSSGDDDDTAPPTQLPKRFEIEESDIYRAEGNRLFVYSYTKGLTIIDTSDAGAPALTGEVALPASKGEIYVRASRVYVVLNSSSECEYGDGEVVSIDATISPPEIESRVCLAATPIASRLVGDVLYAVSSDSASSWIESVRIADPSQIGIAATLSLEGGASEIHMTDDALYVTQSIEAGTRLRYVDVTDVDGALAERGSISVTGYPQGRFHMEAKDAQFRIVTYDWYDSSSTLHVIDVSNPDALAQMGSLTAIAPGEQLHATRFVDDRAYVVTFRQTDPLWVIGLADPTQPQILGELQVPGWSDFLFPRGNRLVAVGRGDNGAGVGVSLFDVTNPAEPAALGQLAFGDWSAYSEANTDFRGVGIHEPVGATPLLALPISGVDWSTGECRHAVQLVDVGSDAITARGALQESWAVRRSTPVGGRLFAISDVHVSSIDVTDRDTPISTASLTVGDAAFATPQCLYFESEGGWGDDTFECGGCNVTASTTSPIPFLSLAALAALLRRRR